MCQGNDERIFALWLTLKYAFDCSGALQFCQAMEKGFETLDSGVAIVITMEGRASASDMDESRAAIPGYRWTTFTVSRQIDRAAASDAVLPESCIATRSASVGSNRASIERMSLEL